MSHAFSVNRIMSPRLKMKVFVVTLTVTITVNQSTVTATVILAVIDRLVRKGQRIMFLHYSMTMKQVVELIP